MRAQVTAGLSGGRRRSDLEWEPLGAEGHSSQPFALAHLPLRGGYLEGEVKLELDQAQKELIGKDNVSQEQIKVDGQVEALTEKGKGRFLMRDGLLASTACKSEPGKG
ncbi:unnamed protein product [Caretta caretta]